MDIYHVIKRPLVTEKGKHQSQQSYAATRHRPARGGSYTFVASTSFPRPSEHLNRTWFCTTVSARDAIRTLAGNWNLI